MTILKGTPRPILNGVVDNSGSVATTVAQTIAGFNPVLFLLTERGPEGTNDLDSVGGINAYGSESMRANSIYYNHQSALAQEILPYCPAHVHRVKLPNAARAVIRVSAELATCTVPIYKRDSLGNIVYVNDADGVARPVVDGYTVGSRVILHYGTSMYPENMRGLGKASIIHNFRKGDVRSKIDLDLPEQYLSYIKTFTNPTVPVNVETLTPEQLAALSTDEIMNMISPSGTNTGGDITFYGTTLFPLFETEMAYFGNVGNSFGLIIDDLAGQGTSVGNQMYEIRQFLYQLRLVEQLKSGSKVIINTTGGARTVPFSLEQHSYNERLSVDYSWGSVISKNYSNDLGTTHYYSSNISVLQDMLINGYTLTDGVVVDGELEYGDDGFLSFNSINLLGGVNGTGKQYTTLRTQDAYAFGGSLLGNSYPIMGNDGSDGTVIKADGTPDKLATLRLYDEEVRRQLENFGDLEDQVLDIVRFPFSALVDSGFAQDTKMAMITAYNRRPDVYALLTTFRVAEYTEPETPATPDPRQSLYVAARPPSAWFTANPEYIKAQYLTYTFVKSTDGLTNQVSVIIDPTIPADELMSNGVYKKVPVALGLSYRDWLIVNAVDPTTDVGTEAVTNVLTNGMTTKTLTAGDVIAASTLVIGTQKTRVDSILIRDTSVSTADGAGKSVVADLEYDLHLNWDGDAALYLVTDSTIRIKVYNTMLWVQAEEVLALTENATYNLTISNASGTTTVNKLSAAQVVNKLNDSGITAQLIYDGSILSNV